MAMNTPRICDLDLPRPDEYLAAPARWRDGLRAYLVDFAVPSQATLGFALSGDYRAAVLAADDEATLLEFRQLVHWIGQHVPSLAHGSHGAVQVWTARRHPARLSVRH